MHLVSILNNIHESCMEKTDHFIFIPRLAEFYKLRYRKNVVSTFT